MTPAEMQKAQEIAQGFLDEGFSPEEATRMTVLLFESPEVWEQARTGEVTA